MSSLTRRRLLALGSPLLLSLGISCSKSPTPPGAEAPAAAAAPLKIAYSDWPGWVAWEVALRKGFFQEAGVAVDFSWFEYVPSMDAFAAGKVDAVCMTNGDTLVTGANGARGVMILINDYSNGNDMIVARPGIASVADLKGKTVGVEVGFVDHLLLLKALESAGLTEADVTVKNIATDKTPEALASGSVDAIAAWQPNSGAALKALAGSKAIYSSADVPGLIYDVLAVNPASLAQRKAEWEKVVQVWYRTVDFILNPATQDEAVALMAARVELDPAAYKPLLAGTKLLTRAEALAAARTGDGLDSIHGSTRIVDAFNLKYGVYKNAQPVAEYLDFSLLGAP
jgi:NitT/TauT family transport system substrate-binding protein